MQRLEPGAAAVTCRTLCPCQSQQPGFHICCRIVSNRLVCRIIAHANADYTRHSNQQDSVYTEPRELAIDHDFRGDHVGGHVAAIFANRIVAGVCSSPNPLLAAIIGDAAAVRRAHPGGEDVVGSQAMDLMLVAGRSRLLAAQLRYRARVCAERRSPFTMKAPP